MITKYWRVYKALFKNSVSYEAQYRGDTFFKLITNLLWVGMMFVIIEVVFTQTTAIAGWTKGEIYLMTVFWIIVDELYMTFFGGSIFEISNYVADGDLDQFLTKPVAPLFLVSCRLLLIRAFYRVLTQLVILLVVLKYFHLHYSAWYWLLGILLILCALGINYARTLAANTLAFWFTRIENINDALGTMNTLGKYPISIWPKTLKIILLTIIPVAFSGYIPVAGISGYLSLQLLCYTIAFTILAILAAIKFWNFALTYYSSASS